MPGFGSGDLLLSSRRDNRPKKGYVPLAAVRRSRQVPSDAFPLEEDERCGVVSRSAASFASHSVGVHPPHLGHVPRGRRRHAALRGVHPGFSTGGCGEGGADRDLPKFAFGPLDRRPELSRRIVPGVIMRSTRRAPPEISDAPILSRHGCSSRRRSTGCPRSSPLPGGPPRVHSPALFQSESHTHLLVWFSRDQGYRGSVDPDWSRPPRSVFHDPEFHESRGSDYLQVLSSDHRVSHTAAIVFDGSQVPFLDDVRDHESSAWLEDPERLCKYGRRVAP